MRTAIAFIALVLSMNIMALGSEALVREEGDIHYTRTRHGPLLSLPVGQDEQLKVDFYCSRKVVIFVAVGDKKEIFQSFHKEQPSDESKTALLDEGYWLSLSGITKMLYDQLESGSPTLLLHEKDREDTYLYQGKGVSLSVDYVEELRFIYRGKLIAIRAHDMFGPYGSRSNADRDLSEKERGQEMVFYVSLSGSMSMIDEIASALSVAYKLSVRQGQAMERPSFRRLIAE